MLTNLYSNIGTRHQLYGYTSPQKWQRLLEYQTLLHVSKHKTFGYYINQQIRGSVFTTTTISSNISSMTSDDKQRVTIFINPAIAKHARAQAVFEEITLTDLIEKSLIKYLPEETVIKKTKIVRDLRG